jgi:hypothetical protein
MRLILHARNGGQKFVVEFPDGTMTKPLDLPQYGLARSMLADGWPADTAVEFQHAGSSIVSSRGIIGELAKWTVREATIGGKKRTPYVPMPSDLHDSDSSATGVSPAADSGLSGVWEP